MLIGLGLKVVGMSSGSYIKCPFCRCVFCSEEDLALHLKAFGSVPHVRELKCVHILLEEDEHNAGVDEHCEWHWSNRSPVYASSVRVCRKLLEKG